MMQSFIRLFASHKVAPNLLMLLLFLSGAYGLKQLNTQFFPDFAVDVVTVNIVWPGAAAEDVQNSITIPVEQELKNVANVSKVKSSTSRGGVSLRLEVASSADLTETTNAIKQRLDAVSNLPTDAETPTIEQFVMYENVGTVLITADGPVDELTNLARQAERELLAKGISKINFTGLPKQEIAIQVEPTTIHDLGLSLQKIAGLINNQSQDVMAGTAGRTDGSKQLRAIGKVSDVSSFEQLPLLTGDNAQLLRLGDVADISLRPKEDQSTIQYEGKPAIQLVIMRSKNDDTIKTAAIMNKWVVDARKRFPQNVELIVYDERWLLLKARITLLINNGAYGLLFVVGLLFMFLNSRVAFWVAMGIPASLLATWGVMYFIGGSINMISLFGMIMALGIIVDDAIVVGEDTLAHFQQGEAPLQAALGGAQRMMGPITASSLTTIAAFLPLLLINGTIGSILADIPVVVICVILVSLVECFLVLPGHLHHALKNQVNKKPSRIRAWFDRGFESFKNSVFRPAVSFAIDFRFVTFSLAITALVLAVGLLVGGRIQFAFFPSVDGDSIRANVQFSSGTPASEVAAYLAKVDDALLETEAELGGDLISERVFFYGTNKLPTAGISSTEQIALLRVELDSSKMRLVTNAAFIEAWNNKLPKVSGLEKIIIDQPQSGPPGKPIEANITGASADVMKQVALDLQTALKVFTGVQNIDDNLPYGMEQLIFNLTPEAATLGLTSADIGRQLRYAFDGVTVQSFYLGADEIDVRLMLKDQDRNSLSTLYALPVILPSGNTVPLMELVEFSSRRGIDKFSSENGQLTVTVKADVDVGATNANVVIGALKKDVIPNLERDYGVKITFGGAKERERGTLGDMLTGLVLALVLIYIVLAWVFASYTWPVAVMFTIPFGLTGAILGHLAMERDLTILSLFGLFGLSGIVINNSIVLLSFYKGFREQGIAPKEAIIEAACQRLRAVLLTSMTTIAGLTPILFEESLQAQFLIPMAISIVFGLALGTLLILFVVPSMVLMLENLNALLAGRKRST
ncbi:efflux RND transporter permease subunit [Oceanospirillaceae bacterium]|jgi:multidrug efflux pump subunit AcrB|nr:efflux RND transporter permease subunit [Oceanospirillaceae bacterium]MDB4536125.1 efflux RND transporter permease subunit [Oceanospirillaceae bacterium]MDB9906036.1 efflux RND transporter permease subunit [Oceanospirillaceae bacterium]MDC0084436.1 efflux RND transporter permease subunit [Oceanospirillaceae bacterium]|tara:strand:+ start:320 stop:3421 length:3102 start_codon:yes stop_codon:yes gene_type:complete